MTAPNVITIQTQLIQTGFNPQSQTLAPATDCGLFVFINLDQSVSHCPQTRRSGVRRLVHTGHRPGSVFRYQDINGAGHLPLSLRRSPGRDRHHHRAGAGAHARYLISPQPARRFHRVRRRNQQPLANSQPAGSAWRNRRLAVHICAFRTAPFNPGRCPADRRLCLFGKLPAGNRPGTGEPRKAGYRIATQALARMGTAGAAAAMANTHSMTAGEWPQYWPGSYPYYFHLPKLVPGQVYPAAGQAPWHPLVSRVPARLHFDPASERYVGPDPGFQSRL